MLTNECHRCGNLIEFPDHGVGEEIHCPHCGVPVLLTDSSKTLPPQSPPPEAFGQPKRRDATVSYAKGEDLLPASKTESNRAGKAVVDERPGRSARRVSTQKLGLAGVVLGAIVATGIFLVASRRGPTVELSAAHQEAVARLEQDARAARAPTGLFGAKWLMSMAEVTQAVPNAKRVTPEILSEKRTYHDRQAEVIYHFTNDNLLLITVSFAGPGNPTEFEKTQARLSAEFGTMPPPAKSPEYSLSSKKRLGHFVVEHVLNETSGATVEQVFLYVGKGGDPRNMPKLKSTSPK